MAWYNKFPWTNFHELNLDWIINQVSTNTDNISQLQGAINNIRPGIVNSNIITVGANGAMFNDINKAIGYARDYCGANNRVAIIIMPGNYTADIDLAPNPGIDLIGIGRPVIKSASSGYPRTALYTAGQGYFEGIEFVGTVTYAVHVEVQGLTGNTSGTTVFNNCRFTSPTVFAFGAGIGLGNNLTCRNCEFSSPAGTYGLYLHNYPSADNPVTASFISCNFAISGSGAFRIDDAARNLNITNVAPLYVTFKDCVTYNEAKQQAEFRLTQTEIFRGIYQGGNIYLRSCDGNTHPALQHYINEIRTTWAMFSNASGTLRIPVSLDSDIYTTVQATTFLSPDDNVSHNVTLEGVIRSKSALFIGSVSGFTPANTNDCMITYTATW